MEKWRETKSETIWMGVGLNFCGEDGKECWNGKCVGEEYEAEEKICLCNTKNCNCECQCKPKPTNPPSSGTDSGGKLSQFLKVILFIWVINNH